VTLLNFKRNGLFFTINQARIAVCKKEAALLIFKKLWRSTDLLKCDCITFAAFSETVLIVSSKEEISDQRLCYKAKKRCATSNKLRWSIHEKMISIKGKNLQLFKLLPLKTEINWTAWQFLTNLQTRKNYKLQ
jgi:hypothetical protein